MPSVGPSLWTEISQQLKFLLIKEMPQHLPDGLAAIVQTFMDPNDLW